MVGHFLRLSYHLSPEPGGGGVGSYLSSIGWGRVIVNHSLYGSGVIGGMELADQPERHVDAGRYALGGDDVAVPYVPHFRQQGHLLVLGKRFSEHPVGGGLFSGKESCLLENQGAGAD